MPDLDPEFREIVDNNFWDMMEAPMNVLERKRVKCSAFKSEVNTHRNAAPINAETVRELMDERDRLRAELESARARFTAPIVCICGSTRFKQAWIWENARLTQEGNIVLAVGLWGHCKDGGGNPLGLELTDECKTELDALHKRKIDLCDWVWVLDVGGYIGSSTRSEIEYAEAHGKPVRYLSKEFPNYVEPTDPLERLTAELAEAKTEIGNLFDRLRMMAQEVTGRDGDIERLTKELAAERERREKAESQLRTKKQ